MFAIARNLPIRYKIIFIVLFVSILGLGLNSFFNYFYENERFSENFLRQTNAQTDLIGKLCINALNNKDSLEVSLILKDAANSFGNFNLKLFNGKKELIAEYPGEKDPSYSFRNLTFDSANTFSEGKYLQVMRPLRSEGSVSGFLYLKVLTDIHEYAHRRLTFICMTLVFTALISFLLAVFLQDYVTASIVNLTNFTHLLSQQRTFSLRLKKKSEEEIGELTDEFNRMLDVIQSRERERDTAMEALRESETRFITMVENLPGIVYRCTNDSNWTILYISEGVEELTGYPARDFTTPHKRKFSEIIYSPDLQAYELEVKESVLFHRSYIVEYRILTGNNQLIWVQEQGQGVFDKNTDDVVFRDGVILNITERKKNEQTIKISEEKYRLLFENMTNAFALGEVICNESGDTTNIRFLEVNPGFEKYMGAKASDIVGKPASSLWPKMDKKRIEAYGKVATTGKPWAIEELSEDSGKYFSALAYGLTKGKFALIISDIHERKLLEIELKKHKERLEDLVRERTTQLEKSRMAALNLAQDAHKEKLLTEEALTQLSILQQELKESNKTLEEKVRLRTMELAEANRKILSAIIEAEERERNNFSRELHDGLGPMLSTIKLYFQWLAETESGTKRQNIVDKGNQNIDEAIQTLKEISNNLTPRTLSNLGFVPAVRNFIQGLIETNKLSIDFDCNTDVRFDRKIEITLYRITTELLNNTIKYANATHVKISFRNEDNRLFNYQYTDNGNGFDMDKAARSNKGLGLTNIVQRIHNLNGNMDMKSSEGSGVLVYITIPLQHENL